MSFSADEGIPDFLNSQDESPNSNMKQYEATHNKRSTNIFGNTFIQNEPSPFKSLRASGFFGGSTGLSASTEDKTNRFKSSPKGI